MKAMRKRDDSEFKSRVALEALKGERTIQQIAKGYDVHPVQVSERVGGQRESQSEYQEAM
jgi:transposase